MVKERRRIGLEADVESSADVESNVGVRIVLLCFCINLNFNSHKRV